MKKSRITLLLPALFFVFCMSGQEVATAQSTLMNIPSTDVVASRKVYLEFDFLTNYAWQREGSFKTTFREP
jgi:hypothetical protein